MCEPGRHRNAFTVLAPIAALLCVLAGAQGCLIPVGIVGVGEDGSPDGSVDARDACLASVETCNGIDDDCDGVVDDGAVCVEASVDAEDATDAGPVCAPPMSSCGAACVDLSTDPRNCGVCGQMCTVGTTCVAGICPRFDAGDATDTPGCSTDTDCPTGLFCVAGTCQIIEMDAGCTPSPEICNGLDDDCDGMVDEIACVDAGMDAAMDAGGPCVAPLVACGGACVDLESNRSHCGSCFAMCMAMSSCIAGACTP